MLDYKKIIIAVAITILTFVMIATVSRYESNKNVQYSLQAPLVLVWRPIIKVDVITPTPTHTQIINPVVKPKTEEKVKIKTQSKVRVNDYDRVLAWVSRNYQAVDDAMELIRRESTYNSHAVNASSGACGLPQALPCEKMGCQLGDVECQLRWQKNYIEDRYGTVSKALGFHTKNGYY